MKLIKIKYIKLFAFLGIGFCAMSFGKPVITETKVLTEQFMVDPSSHIKVRNDCGPIQFKNTDDAEARVEATLTVDGKAKVEIDKMFCFMGHVAAEVSSNDAMPGRVVFFVEFFLDPGSYVLFYVVFFKTGCRAVYGILLHLL